ncbi:MAG TPA: LysR family transcriptional regulator [Ideonella sp.]|uniref:LysR family transcriptional regulator n=1 Tax=Ideonella sp. TaxID=1929293 RepID=UPI002CF9DFDF|nr:LysR family transcriptional regulator [Ideonella sp.]HSI50370.1 LysR family transcriptional regulator [Ideonella sp.]
MPTLPNRMPPLQSLQAFEASARHLSFSRAAEEMHLTHGAISRQVRGLEAQLGERLLARVGPRLSLTPAGRELLGRLGEPLLQLRQALQPDVPASERLELATLASFASLWLAPRLPALREALPGLQLRVETHYALSSFPPDRPRLGLRYGSGRWPGLKATALMQDRLVLLATPAALRRHGRDPAAWPASAWVRHEGTLWEDWQPQAPEPQGHRDAALVWNDAAAMVQALVATDGVGLARLSLAAGALAAKKLRLADALLAPAPMRYWLVTRPEYARHAGLKALAAQLLVMAGAWEAQWLAG